MFANRQEWVDTTLDLIQNERSGHGIDRAIIEDQADSVVSWLARYAPRHVLSYFDGDGSTYRFAFTSLSTADPAASWVKGLSVVKQIEYPLLQRPRAILQPDQWTYYPDYPSATSIELESDTPASGADNVGVLWTTVHTVGDAAVSPATLYQTVPDHEEPAYEYALAAASLRIYAARYLHTTNSEIDADSINYRSKYSEALAVAKAFEAKASTILGVDITGDPGAQGAGQAGQSAGGWVDLDVSASGMSPIFRSRTQR